MSKFDEFNADGFYTVGATLEYAIQLGERHVSVFYDGLVDWTCPQSLLASGSREFLNRGALFEYDKRDGLVIEVL